MTCRPALALDNPWAFPPSPKVGPGSRSVAPEETLCRLQPLLARIPITRVADLTPLDVVGLPVFAACTPLAADLAVNLGKGLDPLATRLSALMEAVERVSAEPTVERPGAVRATFEELLRRPRGRQALDPWAFTLPAATAYRRDREIGWIAGNDLLNDEPVWLAADLAVNPPADGVLVDVDTNGLASGNTHLEAVVHAICEVIERDAFSQLEFTSIFGGELDPAPPARLIDLATLPPMAGGVAERLRAAGQHVVLLEITSDLGVATFAAHVLDPDYPSASGPVPRVFLGLGTHPDASVAAARALVEANQSRLSAIQGARDSFNTGRARRRAATMLKVVSRFLPVPAVAFSQVASIPSGDVRSDLVLLLDRLQRCGLDRCIAVDLTRADLGVPVVRIRVPGLSQFVADMRRVDTRCRRWLL
jgi:ribosomal protein S12 methylthiotransferase accessory factor